jgi:hypothetical protein
VSKGIHALWGGVSATAAAIALRHVYAGLEEQRAGLARAVVRDERHLPGRCQPADVEEMVAVALGAEVPRRRVRGHRQEAVLGELRDQGLGRPHVVAVGPSAAAEVRELHASIQHRRRVDVAQNRERHGAADVG